MGRTAAGAMSFEDDISPRELAKLNRGVKPKKVAKTKRVKVSEPSMSTGELVTIFVGTLFQLGWRLVKFCGRNIISIILIAFIVENAVLLNHVFHIFK